MSDLSPTSFSDLLAAFSDLERLGQLHRLVEECAPEQAPCLRLIEPGEAATSPSLAVLAGSFNPLTDAHLALAEAAETAGLGRVALTLSTWTIDKERVDGAMLEDRLLMLALSARRTASRAVALVNRGLYVEQAALFREALPDVQELTFIVGFDKIVQIFDPRYYDDRDAALHLLFAKATFAVAPRAGAADAELAELLSRPENQEFAGAVRPLQFSRNVDNVSSSAIREATVERRPLLSWLPPESLAFIQATGCYADAESAARYARRQDSLLRGPRPDRSGTLQPW